MPDVSREGSQEQRGGLRSLVNNATVANFGAFALSLANEIVTHNPVSFSQTAMEAADTVLPLTIIEADRADRKNKITKAIGWRTLANSVHIVAAGAGIWGASTFINNPGETKASNIAISAAIGLWNLRILRGIRKYRSAEEAVTPNGGRNSDNLGTLVASNIVEAVPPLLGPLMQLAYENGSVTTVMAANSIIIAMNSGQILKDMSILNRQRQK